MTIRKKIAESVLPNLVLYRIRAYKSMRRDNPELILLKRFNQGGIMVDVGANIGDYSRVGCLRFRAVVAFEPVPDRVRQLKAELPKNATIYPTALSDCAQPSTLYIPRKQGKLDDALASLERTAHQTSDGETIAVYTRTLDSYGLVSVDLIKIDVEGHEFRVLCGAADTIRRYRPVLIIEIEDKYHPGHTMEVFSFLTEFGYRAYYYHERKLYPARIETNPNETHAGTYAFNFIFLQAEQMILLQDLIR